SCPLLYSHTGEGFNFVSDFSSSGRLVESNSGLLRNYFDYIRISSEGLVAEDGAYSLRLTEEEGEISYIDEVKLITLDFDEGYSVYTGLTHDTKGEYFSVFNAGLQSVVSCTDEFNADCSELVAEMDDLRTAIADYENPRTFTFDLGDLSEAENIKLLMSYAK